MGSILMLLGGGLMVVASVASLIFGIQILIAAFQKSVLWGLGSLFVPFVSLVFVIMHWEETKTPFLRSLLACVVMMVGGGVMAMGAAMQ